MNYNYHNYRNNEMFLFVVISIFILGGIWLSYDMGIFTPDKIITNTYIVTDKEIVSSSSNTGSVVLKDITSKEYILVRIYNTNIFGQLELGKSCAITVLFPGRNGTKTVIDVIDCK